MIAFILLLLLVAFGLLTAAVAIERHSAMYIAAYAVLVVGVFLAYNAGKFIVAGVPPMPVSEGYHYEQH